MGTREPRLNIRFPDFTVIDEIEISAHQLGLKKNAWVREAIEEKLRNEATNQSIKLERIKGELEIRKLMRMMAGPKRTEEARAYVKQYLKEVEHHDDQYV